MTSQHGLTERIEPLILRLKTSNESDRRAAVDDLIRLTCERVEILTRTILRDHPQVRRREATGDVAGTVTLKLYKYLGGESLPNDARHFLRLAARMIRFTILELAEQHRRQPNLSILGAGPDLTDPDAGAVYEPAAATVGPDVYAEWTEFHRHVEQLPDDEREVFEMRYYNGLGVAECAELIGVDERTIKRRWSRARINLQEALESGPQDV